MRLEELLAADPVLPRWEEWRDLPPVRPPNSQAGGASYAARPVTVPEIPGFALEVRLLDVPGTVAMVRAGEDPETQLLATLRQAVTGWRGLTVAGLKRLLPGARFKGEVADTCEFPYTPDNLEALLRRSFVLVNWLLRVMELRQVEEEDLEKNSAATPRASSTPRPAPAGGAAGKRRSTA